MEPPENEQIAAVIAARERDPSRAILLLISVILIAAAAGLLMMAGRLDWERSLIGKPASFSLPPKEEPAVESRAEDSSGGLITNMAVFASASDPETLQGRQVTLRNVPVLVVPGDYTFWVGPDRKSGMPVLLLGEETARQRDTHVEILPGQRVDIFGIVRRMGGARAILNDPLLDAAERTRLLQKRCLYQCRPCRDQGKRTLTVLGRVPFRKVGHDHRPKLRREQSLSRVPTFPE